MPTAPMPSLQPPPESVTSPKGKSKGKEKRKRNGPGQGEEELQEEPDDGDGFEDDHASGMMEFGGGNEDDDEGTTTLSPPSCGGGVGGDADEEGIEEGASSPVTRAVSKSKKKKSSNLGKGRSDRRVCWRRGGRGTQASPPLRPQLPDRPGGGRRFSAPSKCRKPPVSATQCSAGDWLMTVQLIVDVVQGAGEASEALILSRCCCCLLLMLSFVGRLHVPTHARLRTRAIHTTPLCSQR